MKTIERNAVGSPHPGMAPAAPMPKVLAVTSAAPAEVSDALARARAFAEPLIAHELLDSGENMMAHADAGPRS